MFASWFLGSSAGSFSIDSTTAAITTAAVFDYETTTSYGDGTTGVLAVKVVDGNGGSTTVAITVSVTDVNDTPTFGAASYTASVDEEQSSGTAITFGSALSTSDEEGDTVTYSLVGKVVPILPASLNVLDILQLQKYFSIQTY